MTQIKNQLIVFANQKGGVGKSTLCMLMADYMAYWKYKVSVIDTDIQSTISVQREYDMEQMKEEPPYSVQAFDICEPDIMQQLMDNAREEDGFVLFDCPGNIKEDGTAVMLANADYIVCPFKYERKAIASTETFIKVLEQLRALNPDMKAKLFFVPNLVDTRIGTHEELAYYAEIEKEFSRYGVISPKVGYRAQMERANTFVAPDVLKSAVYDSFNFMMKHFLGKLEYRLKNK